jgi:hypothetical protein
MPAGKMPGETVRALVTLWLLFHLFGVALALTINQNVSVLPSSPTISELPTSKLIAAVKSTPILSQYMYALWLDSPHNYWLTYGDLADADHSVEMDLIFPDGHKEQSQFPPADSWGEQRERYKMLARRLAMPVYMESTDNFLLAKIGESLLQQTGAKEVDVQIRRHSPLAIDDAAASDPGQHDPNNPRTFATIYTGNVTLNSLGQGEVHTQGELPRDVAPVTGHRSGARNKNQPANNPPSPPPKTFHNILSPLDKPDFTPPGN